MNHAYNEQRRKRNARRRPAVRRVVVSCLVIVALSYAWDLGWSVSNHYEDFANRHIREEMLMKWKQAATDPDLVIKKAEHASLEVLPPIKFVAPPKDHPPLTIDVGSDLYTVKYAPHEWFTVNHCSAYSSHGKDHNFIYLDRNQDWLDVREDVTHELMHAAKHQFSKVYPNAEFDPKGPLPDQEEREIGPISRMYLAILRDNPQLVSWLTKEM